MPSMPQRKVKPLEGVVYIPKSGNVVAVRLASSLYKQFCRSGKLNDEISKCWKDAIIVLVFKKGSTKDCRNSSLPITYSSEE